MNLFVISLALLSGVVLGTSYFGGLRWTVERLQKSQNPMAFYLVSFVARLTIVAACVILALQVGTSFLVAATVGFFAARLFLVARSARLISMRGGKEVAV